MTLKEAFVAPLLADSHSAHPGAGQVVSMTNDSNSASMLVFLSNIEHITTLNAKLLKDLEKRLEAWDPFTSGLGDLFQRYAPLFKIYDEYSRSYEYATKTIDTQRKSSKVFAAFFEKCAADNAKRLKQSNFESFMIMPIQRVPRYVLLLKEVLKYTPETHHDHEELSTALALIKDVASHINEKIRERENIVSAAARARRCSPAQQRRPACRGSARRTAALPLVALVVCPQPKL